MEKYYALPQDRIIEELKAEIKELKEEIKLLQDQWEQSFEYRDVDYEMFKLEEEAEKYYKENGEEVA